MTEQVLLNSGYKYFKDEHYKHCDRFYQKKLSGFDDEPTSFIAVYYYDKFKDNGALDYDFEFEYVKECKHYWKKTSLWAMDKDEPYTIEEIEKILMGDDYE